MDKYLEIKKRFETKEDKENAAAMSKYMRNLFDFYGLHTPERKEIYKDFLKSEKKEKVIDWDFLDKCYEDNHREFQYLVYDYLLALKSYVSFEDIPRIKNYITTKPWWDTIDFLRRVIGDVGLRHHAGAYPWDRGALPEIAGGAGGAQAADGHFLLRPGGGDRGGSHSDRGTNQSYGEIPVQTGAAGA